MIIIYENGKEDSCVVAIRPSNLDSRLEIVFADKTTKRVYMGEIKSILDTHPEANG